MCIDNHLKHLAFQVLSQLSDNPESALAVLNTAIGILSREYGVENIVSSPDVTSGPDHGVIVQFPPRGKSNPA